MLADRPSNGTAVTESHGHFAVVRLDPGNYSVEITHPEFRGLMPISTCIEVKAGA